jgi:hypothetical protein
MEVIIAGDDTEVKASIPEGETVKWHLVARWAKKHCSLDIPIEEWCFDEFDDTADDLVNQCDKEKVSFFKGISNWGTRRDASNEAFCEQRPCT